MQVLNMVIKENEFSNTVCASLRRCLGVSPRPLSVYNEFSDTWTSQRKSLDQNDVIPSSRSGEVW